MTRFLDPGVHDYLRDLAMVQHHDQILLEMETRADEQGFPIVGRAVGRLLEQQARAIGATRVFEMGSGYGYSAYWFARAVGAGGQVVCTDGSADNTRVAEGYLRRAGLWDRVTQHVGDAVAELERTDGEFDVIYVDVDKDGYPACWEAARGRVRVGGLYLCDNVLWDGNVVTGADRDGLEGWTDAVRAHNRAVFSDPGFVTTILPLRDGVLAALRVE